MTSVWRTGTGSRWHRMAHAAALPTLTKLTLRWNSSKASTPPVMPMSYPKRPPPAAAGREIAHGPHRHLSGITTPDGEELLVWSASGSAAAGVQNKRHGAGTRRGSARGGSAAFRSCCMGKRCIAGAQRGQRLVPTCRGNQRHNHHIPAAAAGQAQHSTAQHSTAQC